MDPMTSKGPGAPPGDDSPGAGLANLTGRQVGRYLIGERLGSGGAATVYRAFDQVQGQTVALKVLLPSADEKSYSRFRREATAAGGLRHPNIVRILQVGTAPHGEIAYIAMELVEGESLADLLAQRRALGYGEACALLAPIARALEHAHAAGIVHRDVKPSNILLRPVGRGTPGSVQLDSLDYPVVPLLTDFGIARSLDAPELTSAGRTVGTPAYMAPEQASGSRTVDGRADIYALGTVLYRCVTGRLPYAGSATQILHAHVYEALTIDSAVLARLPAQLVDVLRRMLAKRPEERYQTAGPLAQALEAVAAGAVHPEQGAPDPFSTATMAMPAAQPWGAPPPTATGSTVLVPGTLPSVEAAAVTQGSLGAAPAAEPAEPPHTPRRTLVWIASLTMAVLVIGLTAGMVTAFLRQRDRVTPTPGATVVALISPTFTVTPSPTMTPLPSPTPLPEQPTQEPATQVPVFVPPTATPLPAPSDTPTASASPSATPSATPTSTPTETFTPTWTPTWTPTETPTEAPTWTPTETPSPAPEPPTATPEPPPETTPTPDAGVPPPIVCDLPVEPAFEGTLAAMDEGMRSQFACPLALAQEGSAEAMAFEGGLMLHFGGRPEVYLQTSSGQWERVASGWREGDPELPPPEEPLPEGLYVPGGIFGSVWQEPRLQSELGYALAPAASPLRALEQRFRGGILIADLDSGVVYTLLAQNMRM